MPSIVRTGEFEDELWELERDLPTLANQAAIELDDRLLGRGSGFAAVRRLATRLASDVTNGAGTPSNASQYDPITISIVNRAVDELPGVRPTNVSEVVEYARQLAKRLSDVADKPESVSEESLAQLRDQCLAISENATMSEQPPDINDPQYPFGR